VDVNDQRLGLGLRDRLAKVRKLELREGRIPAHESTKGLDLRPPTPIIALDLLEAGVDQRSADSLRSESLDLCRSTAHMKLVTASVELEQHVDGREDVSGPDGLVDENSRHQRAPFAAVSISTTIRSAVSRSSLISRRSSFQTRMSVATTSATSRRSRTVPREPLSRGAKVRSTQARCQARPASP